MMIVNSKLTAEDKDLIIKIVNRYEEVINRIYHTKCQITKSRYISIITAAHTSAYPLRLTELLSAQDFDIVHDVVGIVAFMDMKTKQLTNEFLPRYLKH